MTLGKELDEKMVGKGSKGADERNEFLEKNKQTVIHDEHVWTNKTKDLQSQEQTDLGMNSVRWQKVGVSLRKKNNIAVIDNFNRKKKVLQSSMHFHTL